MRRLLLSATLWILGSLSPPRAQVLPCIPGGLGIQVVQNLQFGGLQSSPAGGRITLTEDGVLVPDGPGILPGSSPPCEAARFALTGPPRTAFILEITPAMPYLTHVNGARLRVAEWRPSLPRLQGIFDATGQAELRLGARLDIPAGAPSGTYTAPSVLLRLALPSGAKDLTCTRSFLSTAQIRAPICFSNTGPLDFGWLFAGSAGGFFEVLPEGGHGSPVPGGPLLVRGSVRPASFEVQGPTGTCYHLQLPTIAMLAGPGPALVVDQFRASIRRDGLLPAGGLNFGVGARLRIPPEQPPGSYRGTFTVCIAYQ